MNQRENIMQTLIQYNSTNDRANVVYADFKSKLYCITDELIQCKCCGIEIHPFKLKKVIDSELFCLDCYESGLDLMSLK